MSNTRNTIVWAVFIFSLFLLWNKWQIFNGKEPLFGHSQTPQVVEELNDVPNPTSIVNNGASNEIPAENVATEVASKPGEKITITTDEVRVVFDSLGARIVELDLLNHFDQKDNEKSIKLVDPTYNYEVRTGLVNGVAGGIPLPNHNTQMHLVSNEKSLADDKDKLDVRFESDAVNGVKMAKTYEFIRGSFLINVKTEIINGSDQIIQPEVYYELIRNGVSVPGGNKWFGGNLFTGPAYYTDDTKYKKVSFSDIDKKSQVDEQSNNGWIAMVQHYFVSAWIQNEEVQRHYFTRKLPNQNYSIAFMSPVSEIQAGGSASQTAELYVGPQNEKVLEELSPGLELVKDYGIFRILSKPLFWLLYYLESFLGNWGWAIVALVVLLKAAFFWLNARAYQSMARMRKLSPRMQEINERYKDEPQQKQQEMMRLYREEKINPLGGCLPILVQIPVFIALYWVLLSSVEMRHAPWIGWITDLSAKDPYYILPAVMAASTMLQTWLNPKPADPTQAKIMWMMPLMFSVLFFMFPAGLVLYWVTNNLLSIAQQWFINNKLVGKDDKK